jgi:hypothetical protein
LFSATVLGSEDFSAGSEADFATDSDFAAFAGADFFSADCSGGASDFWHPNNKLQHNTAKRARHMGNRLLQSTSRTTRESAGRTILKGNLPIPLTQFRQGPVEWVTIDPGQSNRSLFAREGTLQFSAVDTKNTWFA